MLDREYTKDQILERYLNTVFFGNNAYGIQAAAETYFGKTADQLSFIEAAFLAGLVRSPTGYDPINNPERSRGRFVQVLDRLVDDGYITGRGGHGPGHRLRAAGADAVDRRTGQPADVLHRGAAGLPAEQVEHPRHDVRRALQHAVPRRPAHPHHVQPHLPGPGRDGPQRPARQRPGLRCVDRLAGHRARGRSGRWSAVAASCPTSARSTWRCSPARRARASSCSSSPPRSRPGPSPTTSSTGQNVCTFAVPDQPPFVIKDAAQPGARHGGRDDVALDQLRLRAPGPDRRAQPDGRHDVPDGPVGLPLPRAAGRRAPAAGAVRQLLDRGQRDGADRHGVGRPDHRQRRAAPRAVLRRLDRRRRRPADLHPRRRRHAGARQGRGPGGDRHAEGRAAHRARPGPTRWPEAGRRPARPAPSRTTRTPGSSASRRS